MGKMHVFICMLLLSGLLRAEVPGAPGVLQWNTSHDLETVYDSVYKSLEDNRFFVVFEPNIGRNLAGFSERWGEDYNRNKLTGIRSMVFCNAWYANQVSNLDPVLLALCPLHITLYGQGGKTQIVFLRPGFVSEGSKAQSVLQEVEDAVAAAIEDGIKSAAP